MLCSDNNNDYILRMLSFSCSQIRFREKRGVTTTDEAAATSNDRKVDKSERTVA